MKRRKPWFDFLAYLAVRMTATVLAMFPIETNLRIMRRVGWIWFHLPHWIPESHPPAWFGRNLALRWIVVLSAKTNRLLLKFREHRNRAETHIRKAFPNLDERAVSKMALLHMQQVAMLAVELLSSPRLITRWTWARHVRLIGLGDAIRVLLEPRGCIMLTAHYGNWELLGYTLATLGFDIVAVMRPLDNEYLNRFLLDRREKSGLRLLYKKGMAQSASDVIESGGALCFIADQNAGRKGLMVDFFQQPASTYKSIGLLAIQHEVPIIVGCARRASDRFEYEIHVNRIIRPDEWRDQADPLVWVTETFSKAMEDFIRVAPEQYLWIHRRWKQPSGRKKEKRRDIEDVQPV